jgi:hypothetical protein
MFLFQDVRSSTDQAGRSNKASNVYSVDGRLPSLNLGRVAAYTDRIFSFLINSSTKLLEK